MGTSMAGGSGTAVCFIFTMTLSTLPCRDNGVTLRHDSLSFEVEMDEFVTESLLSRVCIQLFAPPDSSENRDDVEDATEEDFTFDLAL